MKSPLETAQKRTRRYWYEDGLSEMAAGAVILLMALINLAIALLAPAGWKGWLSAVGLPVMVIGGGVLARLLVARLKERLTYPRTGYIRYPRPKPTRRFLSAGIAIGVALIVTIMSAWFSAAQTERLIPALTGLLTAILILSIGASIGLVRFYLLAVWQFGFGLLGSRLNLPAPYDLVLFFGALGIGLFISGGITLLGYLRNNPLPPANDEEQS
ncbi:hypothetical protein BECAL_00226 [Bellilinea caldifistulae]|uniref:Uncharacterized protein n=1 Tax=Bellilinea caldifistulae TaxID=360411 RepID=A0A0P6X8I9_9CHLR|nr:hypothetical protein [Bellilinea caldifistulae]KPL79286.1 hypothetical protein AC812_00210 [Bellilinea caldifistulae]GAP09087.1 hypothetical protein BECAL_00226 [Bellilinea caldifistulae]